MTEKRSPDEVAVWQRRLASHANNRAWSLSESLSRTPEEDEEMLQAAHAAMMAHGVAANVAAATKDAPAQREHYEKAVGLMEVLPAVERKILGATLRVVPAPKVGSRPA